MTMNRELTSSEDKENTLSNLSERYEHLKSLVTERRSEFDRLCKFAEKETEYLTAPASTRFHLCRESGLLEHSVNVCETMLKMKNTLAPEISDESCVVTALFHDLGKVGMPDNPMYIKNVGKGGKDASVPYSFNDKMTYMSVPLRSLYFILPLFPRLLMKRRQLCITTGSMLMIINRWQRKNVRYFSCYSMRIVGVAL